MNNKEWFVADFETTGLDYYKKYGHTKVWLYAICNSNGDIVNYGTTIEEFMKWCYNNPTIEIYFHNLKFDGSFILNYLLERELQTARMNDRDWDIDRLKNEISELEAELERQYN